jgi:hypothetical protein
MKLFSLVALPLLVTQASVPIPQQASDTGAYKNQTQIRMLA